MPLSEGGPVTRGDLARAFITPGYDPDAINATLSGGIPGLNAPLVPMAPYSVPDFLAYADSPTGPGQQGDWGSRNNYMFFR